MKLKIEMTCDSAAFEDSPELEISRILHKAADRLENEQTSGFNLRDANGNTVGILDIFDE